VEELLSRDGDGPAEEVANKIRVLKRRRRPHGSADDTALLVVRYPQGDDDRLTVTMSSAESAG